jgi:hypothetical protein
LLGTIDLVGSATDRSKTPHPGRTPADAMAADRLVIIKANNFMKILNIHEIPEPAASP